LKLFTINYTRFLFGILIFSTVFLQRIAISIGSHQIPLVLTLTFIILFLLLIRGAKINIARLFLFFGFSLVAFVSLFFYESLSAFSLLYLIALYIPFLFALNSDDKIKFDLLNKFQLFVLITAAIGVLQFAVMVTGGPFIDPISSLPPSFLQQGYLTTYPISFDSSIMKVNGWFYLEPSFFSQFLALSIIIEFVYFKRISRTPLLLVTLILTFSGTGILLLGLAMIPVIIKMGFKKIVLITVLFGVIISIFLTTDYGQYTLHRTQEYKSPNSSFSIRFINPYKAILDTEDGLIFGNGPGSAEDEDFNYPINFSPAPKLIYEYGIISALLFGAFLLLIFFGNRNPLSLPLFIMFFFLSGGLLQPQTVCLIFILLHLASTELRISSKNKPRRKLVLTKSFNIRLIKEPS
jgi:hypothetical protein